MELLHSLLRRQLKGDDLEAIAPKWREFVTAVNRAYFQFDEDRTMLERSMELSSQELVQFNADRLAASDDRFYATFNQAAVGLAHLSVDGDFLLVNRRLCEMLGRPEGELKGQSAKSFSLLADRHLADESGLQLRKGQIGEYSIQMRYVHADGRPVWVNMTVAAVRGKEGESQYDIAVMEDITSRKNIELELERMAKYDTLSGLPNRNLLHDRLVHATSRARRLNQPIGFALFDLDRFKEINDTLGHVAGDTLLRQLAARLTASMRDTDTVARIGGDEFTVILEGCANRAQIQVAAGRLMALFDKPFLIAGKEIYATGSVGVCVYPDDGVDFAELLKRADIAMYAAKRDGGAAMRFFSADQMSANTDGLSLHGELRRALERGEFVLHYQPKMEVRTGTIVGLEALIRWQSPERGLVQPGDFIRVAEETGLIEPIGEWAVGQACADLRRWEAEGIGGLSVAVNLSTRQFRSARLVEVIGAALANSNLEAFRLEIEITESVMMEPGGQTRAVLDGLVAMGVRVAIDDFGTGYSSLAYLKRFPVHALKIDREFVRDIESDPDDAAIVRAIVQLAHSLGLRVVAEGVETPQQLGFLASLHCDEYQGYLFSRPVPASAVISLLRRGSAAPAVQ